MKKQSIKALVEIKDGKILAVASDDRTCIGWWIFAKYSL